MSDSEQKPRPILGLKKTESAQSNEEAPRRRSGARARNVALRNFSDPEKKTQGSFHQQVDENPRSRSESGALKPRFNRDGQDSRDGGYRRDNRESRESREPREGRESREPRDSRESRGPRDFSAPRDNRDNSERRPNRDARDDRDNRDSRGSRSYNRQEAVSPQRTMGYKGQRLTVEERMSRAGELHQVKEEQRAVRQERQVVRRERQADAIFGQELYQVFAPCPTGLEEVLSAELQALGFNSVKSERAGVSFKSDWANILKANLYSRLATRILVQVAQAPAFTEDDIYELAYDTPWERWFGAEHTLRVDTSAVKSPMKSLMFCNLKAKDGICDRLRDKEGERPSIDTVRPDAKVHLFLSETSATLYLDTSGESLFKRGWRLDKGEAPLRENLAAGLLALSGWDPSKPLYDPFCGSGTILIEAAWIAQGVPPGIARPFQFEKLRNFDSRSWQLLKAEAKSNIQRDIDTPIFGSDLDPSALRAAQENMLRARVNPDAIVLRKADASTVASPTLPGWLITNPPYGERIDIDPVFWQNLASNYKKNFAGWQIHMITSDLELPHLLRLKPKRRVPLFNGNLECRLFGFDMVAASYRDK